MARYAAIDVGSNSVLLLVAERGPDGFVTVDERAELTRLGDGLQRSGRLSDLALERTVVALRGMVRAALDEHGAVAVAAVGTEALRSAVNGQDLVRRVARETGVTIQVLGGEEEARLSYVAVRSGLRLGDAAVAIFDVGGGSTELVLGARGGMELRRSLGLGGLTLTERFLRSDPVASEELERLRAHLEVALRQVDPGGPARRLVGSGGPARRLVGSGGPARRLVGMGGAVTTLAAVEMALDPYDPDRVHGSVLSLEQVTRLAAVFAARTVAGRRELTGLHPKRADTILCGAEIVAAVMRRMGAEALTVSDRGLRHGVMEDCFGG